VPADLPSISSTGDKEEQWELRAAKLAQSGQPSPGIVPKGYDGEQVVANSDVSSFPPSFLFPFPPSIFIIFIIWEGGFCGDFLVGWSAGRFLVNWLDADG